VQPTRVAIDTGPDKYTVEPSTPPCDELLHLCKARCCTMTFSLSTADLDEGVIRWDYGQPYLIRQRKSDGYCVHCSPKDLHCTVHATRPRVCRQYDCRNDKRIWIDYEQRIPTPVTDAKQRGPNDTDAHFDLLERARRRAQALTVEKRAISTSFADDEPKIGPSYPR
jgi:Fe-S-cluster containining protein